MSQTELFERCLQPRYTADSLIVDEDLRHLTSVRIHAQECIHQGWLIKVVFAVCQAFGFQNVFGSDAVWAVCF